MALVRRPAARQGSLGGGETRENAGEPAPPRDSPLPPPPVGRRGQRDASAWAACSFDRKLNFFGFVMHSATQVVSLLAWNTLSGSERFQRLLSMVVAGAFWLLPVAVPAWYNRWRTQALAAYRLVFFAFPLLRKPRGIQRVLDGEPVPGARGLLKDMMKIAWGSRLLAVVMATLLNPLPLLPLVPHVLLQVYTVAMVRSNSTLCAAPLLAHPLMARRIHAFHATMHLLAFVLPGGVGQSMYPLLARSKRREAECESFLTFFAYFAGLVLPIWVLVKTEAASSLRAWEDAWYGDQEAAEEQEREQGGQVANPDWPPRPRLSVLARIEAALEASIRQLCGRSWLAPPDRQEVDGMAAAAVAALYGRQVAARRHKPRYRLHGWERFMSAWLVLALLWALTVACVAH